MADITSETGHTAAVPQNHSGEVALSEIRCRNCGAQVAFQGNAQAVKCAFCGSEYVIETGATRTATTLSLPEAQIVPVGIDEKKANSIFLEWLSVGFWKPSDLAQAFKKDGSTMVYVPFWVFNADVYTTWSGLLAQTLYRNVTRTRLVTTGSGRLVEERYADSEPYTNWSPHSGEHAERYWDFIPASAALNQGETDKLRFDGKDLQPLRNGHLQGWQSEKPSVTEQQAMKVFKQRVGNKEGAACRQFVDKLQTCVPRITSLDSNLVYFPIWTFAYKYGNASYRAIINGKTGKIFGKKPVSPTKVAIAVIAPIAALVTLIAAAAIFSPAENGSQSPNSNETPAVESTVSPQPQSDQQTASPVGDSQGEQLQSAAASALENATSAFENQDYSGAASSFDELSHLATDSDVKSRALFVSNALRRLAETNSEADAQDVLAAIRTLRSSIKTSSTSASPFPPKPSDSRATETVAPLQVEKEPQPPPGYVTLNRDVEIGHGTNKFVIPKGSQLLVVSRTERVLGVRFQGHLEIIPKSAATEPK